MIGFPSASRGTGCTLRVVTLTLGLRFRLGGADMTVVPAEEWSLDRFKPAVFVALCDTKAAVNACVRDDPFVDGVPAKQRLESGMSWKKVKTVYTPSMSE